jgi:hypothetical protein
VSWVHLSDKQVTARKVYECFLCGMEIPKGDSHIVREGVFTGEGFVRSRMHVRCELLTKDWGDGDWDAHEPCEFRRYELNVLGKGCAG